MSIACSNLVGHVEMHRFLVSYSSSQSFLSNLFDQHFYLHFWYFKRKIGKIIKGHQADSTHVHNYFFLDKGECNIKEALKGCNMYKKFTTLSQRRDQTDQQEQICLEGDGL